MTPAVMAWLRLPALLLGVNSLYAVIINNDLQHGPEHWQWTVPYCNPLAVWLTVYADLGGEEYFWALLIVGGLQWALIGFVLEALLRLARRLP